MDTGFPGVVLAIAMIRLSCLFTDVYHSKLVVENPIFQRIPFAILSTDAAGNIAYVFAPFLISFIVLVISDLLSILFARRMVKHQGDMFLLTFVCFALSEMVLEGTQYDVLRLHFTFLYSVNKYVSFISFSMFIFGICMLVVFFVNHRKAVKKTGHRKSTFPMIVFILAFLCFCVCEYLVQRYTSQEVLFHLIQAGLAATMAVSTIMVINLKNTRVKRKRKSENTLRPQSAAAPAATEPVVAEQQPG